MFYGATRRDAEDGLFPGGRGDVEVSAPKTVFYGPLQKRFIARDVGGSELRQGDVCPIDDLLGKKKK